MLYAGCEGGVDRGRCSWFAECRRNGGKSSEESSRGTHRSLVGLVNDSSQGMLSFIQPQAHLYPNPRRNKLQQDSQRLHSNSLVNVDAADRDGSGSSVLLPKVVLRRGRTRGDIHTTEAVMMKQTPAYRAVIYFSVTLPRIAKFPG